MTWSQARANRIVDTDVRDAQSLGNFCSLVNRAIGVPISAFPVTVCVIPAGLIGLVDAETITVSEFYQ